MRDGTVCCDSPRLMPAPGHDIPHCERRADPSAGPSVIFHPLGVSRLNSHAPHRLRPATLKDRYGSRPWKNAFAEDDWPTFTVRLRQGLRGDPGTQARIACSSGPTPMIAITRFML